MVLRFFDFNDVEIHMLTPVPVSIREGLVLDSTFIDLEKEAEDVTVYVGLGGEVLVSENPNPVHVLKLEYLPNSKGAIILGGYARLGLAFGITIQAREPRYKGIASYCRIRRRAGTSISRDGLENHKYQIIMTDYMDETGI